MIDNRKGAERQFAFGLRAALTDAGFEVELLEPSPQARYDTAVHLVVEGVSIRVPEGARPRELGIIAATVRQVEARRRNVRGRFRAVPIYQGESSRVLTWVDMFG